MCFDFVEPACPACLSAKAGQAGLRYPCSIVVKLDAIFFGNFSTVRQIKERLHLKYACYRIDYIKDCTAKSDLQLCKRCNHKTPNPCKSVKSVSSVACPDSSGCYCVSAHDS